MARLGSCFVRQNILEVEKVSKNSIKKSKFIDDDTPLEGEMD